MSPCKMINLCQDVAKRFFPKICVMAGSTPGSREQGCKTLRNFYD